MKNYVLAALDKGAFICDASLEASILPDGTEIPRLFNVLVDKLKVQDINLGTKLFCATTNTSGNILIGTDILKDWNIFIGSSLIDDKDIDKNDCVLIACPESISDKADFYDAVYRYLGFIPADASKWTPDIKRAEKMEARGLEPLTFRV